MAMLDLDTAFDTADHDLSLSKVKAMGFVSGSSLTL